MSAHVVSVLLPCRDAAATLREAAESVLADLEEHDELVVIDDGSRDGSAAIARALAGIDRRVICVESGGTPASPAGVAVTLSRGLAVARGDLVGRMDADDVSVPGRFAAQRERLARDASLGAVGALVEPFPAPAPGMQRYVAWQNAVVTPEDHARAIFVESPLCHPSTTIRRSALEQVGGFRDERWPQDYDLWLRLDAAGFGLAKVDRLGLRWRIHAASVTWTNPRNAAARILEARAAYLALRLRSLALPFAIWGAGQTGRRLARALEAHELRPARFVDIDPRKIGGTARGLPIVSADEAIALARGGGVFLVVAVGDVGARDVVRARLSAAGLEEGRAYLCAA